MVDVDITKTEVVLRVRGLHKLWAFKSEVRIPLAELKLIEQGVDPEARAMRSLSLRLPGTSVPLLITAGSFRVDGQWAFWDVAGNGGNAVTFLTAGHRYAQVVVDVADPRTTVEAVQRAIRSFAARA